MEYGAGIQIRPVATRAGLREGLELIEFELQPDTEDDAGTGTGIPPRRPMTATVGEGTMTEGVFLAHIGEKIIVVCDRHHWTLFGKPAVR